MAEAAERVDLSLSWADAGWIGSALALGGLAQYRYHNMSRTDSSALDRDDLMFFDRWVAGRYSNAAAKTSDFLVAPFCLLPAAVSAWEAARGETSTRAAVADVVVLSEALILASSINLIVRSLQVHPRPYVYGTEAPRAVREEGQASGSWYSGHASASFLAATYFSFTYTQRHPEFKGDAWLWAGTLAAAAGVASLRVAAGRHFPSDIVVGAAAGAFFGWVVPRLHMDLPEGGSVSMRLQPRPSTVYPLLVLKF